MNLFEKLAANAALLRLRFLVIGGHAVNFHGFQRGTEDADILICRSDADAWRKLIPEMGFRLVHEQETFLQFGSLDSAEWDLDLMIVPAETFERLFAAAEPAGLALPDWSGQVAHVSRVPRAQWMAYCQANLPRLRRQPGFAARRRENGIRAEFRL